MDARVMYLVVVALSVVTDHSVAEPQGTLKDINLDVIGKNIKI